MGVVVASQYGVPHIGDSEKSAQEPTVSFNLQPATERTVISDFQLHCNAFNQPTVAPSEFPTDVPHEPTSSTSANATSSTGRMLKAASLSSLPSILKQSTSDAGSSRPDSTKIIIISIYKAELKEKNGNSTYR